MCVFACWWTGRDCGKVTNLAMPLFVLGSGKCRPLLSPSINHSEFGITVRREKLCPRLQLRSKTLYDVSVIALDVCARPYDQCIIIIKIILPRGRQWDGRDLELSITTLTGLKV